MLSFVIRYIRAEKPNGFGSKPGTGSRGGGSRFDSGRDQGSRGGDGVGRYNDRFNGRVDKGGYGGMSRNQGGSSGLDDQVLKRINWSDEQLAPLRKNFYKPSPGVAARSREDIEAFEHKHEITMHGRDIPSPAFEFHEVGFPSFITTELTRQGFQQPTVIQSTAWPIAMAGRDLVGIAQTGSGKTLAYILPALIHISNQEKLNRGDGPVALVLAPVSLMLNIFY